MTEKVLSVVSAVNSVVPEEQQGKSAGEDHVIRSFVML